MGVMRGVAQRGVTGACGVADAGAVHGVLMLASVLSAIEAKACVEAGVDIVDCKDPGSGALGALCPNEVRDVVDVVSGAVPVSATVGDLPCRVEPVVDAVTRTAGLGVDFIKVGLFSGREVGGGAGAGSDACNAGGETVLEVIAALGRLDLGGAGLVAVLLADESFDLSLVAPLAEAGFQGVIVDTADKAAGSLLDVLDGEEISRFVGRARRHGLFCGLAGRLRFEDIGAVLGFEPDIIGFRGALCARGIRAHGLDAGALAAVRGAIAQTHGPGLNARLNGRRRPGVRAKRDANVANA